MKKYADVSGSGEERKGLELRRKCEEENQR
jgi:hypothetical protein